MIQAGNLNIVSIGGGRVKGKVIRGRSQSTSAVPQTEVKDMQKSGGMKPPDDSYDLPEPEPDYQDDDVIDAPTEKENTIDMLSHSLQEKVILRERKSSNSDLDKRLSDPGNDELLIKPKKLANPCIASPARMAVHKELLLNYKLGKNVLDKPELNKVFEKVKEKHRVQEWESQKKPNKRTSLEMKLEQQASRLKEQEDSMKPIKEKAEKESELSRIQSKILSKSVNGTAGNKKV